MDLIQSTYLFVLNWNLVKDIKDCYLPIVNSKQLDIKHIINSINLIYLKSNTKSAKTGYYGYFTIVTVLLKENSNYEIENKYSNIIMKSNQLYSNLLATFNLCDINDLIFVKFNSLYKFNKIIKINDYKKLCMKYGSTQIIIPSSKILEDYNIYNLDTKTIINTIENSQNSESDESENEEAIKENIVKEINMIQMDVPILWIPCVILAESLKNKSIKKPILIMHYTKCKLCDITDNNKLSVDFEKKINLQIIEQCEQMDTMINNFYQYAALYSDTEENLIKLNFDENKINIVYYENPTHIYDKCIFIIKK